MMSDVRTYRIHINMVPEHMRDAIVQWIESPPPPEHLGRFLYALLTNDLVGVYVHADEWNRRAVLDWMRFLYNYAPSECWGSVDRVQYPGTRGTASGTRRCERKLEPVRLADLAHGIHDNVAAADYHERVPGIASKSLLDLVRRSPAHAKAWFDGRLPDETTEAMAFGTAFHMALLEPARFDRTYIREPRWGDLRTKSEKSRREAWVEALEGRTPIEGNDLDAICSMCAAVRAHPIAGKIVEGGRAEVTARWRDDETGVECKARADYVRENILVDVKTTQDARPVLFAKSVARWAYHRQSAFYLDGFSTAGQAVDDMLFLAVEKTPPHLVNVCMFDAPALGHGRMTIAEDLRTFAHCLEMDEWPGHPEKIHVIELPPWAFW